MPSRSNSVSSSTANQEPSADSISINVIIADGNSESCVANSTHPPPNKPLAIKLNILPTHTVSNLVDFLKADTTVDTNARLLRDSQPLEPSATVSELKLESGATLSLDPPSTRRSGSPTEEPKPITATVTPTSTASSTPRSSTPAKKPRKPRCTKDGCNALAQPIVGDCGFCQKRFCGKHRMLESHNCEGLEDARQADKDRNAAKLEGERTVMLRGL